jgi:hypothetical protein
VPRSSHSLCFDDKSFVIEEQNLDGGITGSSGPAKHEREQKILSFIRYGGGVALVPCTCTKKCPQLVDARLHGEYFSGDF